MEKVDFTRDIAAALDLPYVDLKNTCDDCYDDSCYDYDSCYESDNDNYKNNTVIDNNSIAIGGNNNIAIGCGNIAIGTHAMAIGTGYNNGCGIGIGNHNLPGVCSICDKKEMKEREEKVQQRAFRASLKNKPSLGEIIQTADKNCNFGGKVTFQIPRNGDFFTDRFVSQEPKCDPTSERCHRNDLLYIGKKHKFKCCERGSCEWCEDTPCSHIHRQGRKGFPGFCIHSPEDYVETLPRIKFSCKICENFPMRMSSYDWNMLHGPGGSHEAYEQVADDDINWRWYDIEDYDDINVGQYNVAIGAGNVAIGAGNNIALGFGNNANINNANVNIANVNNINVDDDNGDIIDNRINIDHGAIIGTPINIIIDVASTNNIISGWWNTGSAPPG